MGVRVTVALVLCLVLAGPLAARPTEEQVEQAIQKGIDYLWTIQQPDGSFSPDHKFWWTQTGSYDHGCEAIACTALAVAGVPLNDERMKKAIDYFIGCKTTFTYVRACRVITLSRLINRKDREPDPRYKAVLEEDVKFLVKIQLDDKSFRGNVGGMWNYGEAANPAGNTNPDFSNTQFALLALQEFEMAGGELANSTFERAANTLEVGDPVTAADEALKRTDLLWLTGRKALLMSPEETAALKTWLRAGGYLVAEACMGDARFDADFAALARTLNLQVQPLGKDDPLVTGTLPVGTGFKLAPVDFSHSLRTDRVGRQQAEFRGLYLDGNLVGVYSPFDVSLAVAGIKAYGNRGYALPDGRAVATNMILPATGRGSNAPAETPKSDTPKAEESKPGQTKPGPGQTTEPLPSGYQVTPN